MEAFIELGDILKWKIIRLGLLIQPAITFADWLEYRGPNSELGYHVTVTEITDTAMCNLLSWNRPEHDEVFLVD